MNIRKALLTTLALFSWIRGHAHDNKEIHPLLSDLAFTACPRIGEMLTTFEISNTTELAYEPHPEVRTTGTARLWLMQGSIDEDAFPESRCLGHFYNPLPQVAGQHRLTDPTDRHVYDSYQWAANGQSYDAGLGTVPNYKS